MVFEAIRQHGQARFAHVWRLASEVGGLIRDSEMGAVTVRRDVDGSHRCGRRDATLVQDGGHDQELVLANLEVATTARICNENIA